MGTLPLKRVLGEKGGQVRLGAVVDSTWRRRDQAFSPSKQPAMWETAPHPHPHPCCGPHLPWAHSVPGSLFPQVC